jgi:glycosyltransferase involved in cell wall biosynthesis
MNEIDTYINLPLVSVIIPAYNAAKFIAETLESVLSQTYQHIEVVVVDDGSKDETPTIVRQFAARDVRVRLIQQANAGVAVARNCAIQNSHGEFIAPIDADDIWYLQKIEKQVQCLMQADSKVGLVYCWSAHIDEAGSFTGGYNTANLQGNILLDLVYKHFIGNGSVPLIRRSCIDQIGGYDKSLHDRGAQGCEDWNIALRVAEYYEFRVVPELLVGYRQAVGSMSSLGKVMERSYNLTVEYIQQNHPEIPSMIYQWSKAEFYYYLAQGARQNGNQWRALGCICKALWLDPETFLKRNTFYRSILSILLSLPFQPIAALLWTPKSWYYFTKKVRFRRKVTSLEQLTPKRKSRWSSGQEGYEKRMKELSALRISSELRRP